MATRKYVQYSITASVYDYVPVENFGYEDLSDEEIIEAIHEYSSDILIEGYPDWDIDVVIIEREEDND